MTGRLAHLGVASDAPGWGGAESCLESLLESDLAELVTVYATDAVVGTRLRRAVPGRVRLQVLPARSSPVDPRPLRPWTQTLRADRLDLLHVNAAFTFGNVYATAAAALTRTPFVLHEHLPLAPGMPALQVPVKRALSTRARAQVAVSRAAADDTARILRLPAGSVEVIPNGVSPDLAVSPASVERVAGIPRPWIGAAGRLTSQKGFDLLLRAVARIPEAAVVIVGDGPDRDSLSRLAASLELSGRLHVLGWREDAAQLLGLADVVALPSRAEAGSLVLLEAMMRARPVVASDVGSARELLGSDERGWVVPSGDVAALERALRSALGAPDEAARRGAAAAAAARQSYTTGHMIASWKRRHAEAAGRR